VNQQWPWGLVGLVGLAFAESAASAASLPGSWQLLFQELALLLDSQSASARLHHGPLLALPACISGHFGSIAPSLVAVSHHKFLVDHLVQVDSVGHRHCCSC
jgi:hypothetical protein